MAVFSRISHSADLMTGMTHRLGKSLLPTTGAPTPGQVQRARALALRCMACEDPVGCASLQDTITHLDAPPLFCPNAQVLMALPDA